MAESLLIHMIVRIFIFIFIGFISRKTGLMDAAFQTKLGNLLMKLIIPISLFISANQELMPGQGLDIALFIVFALGYYLVGMALAVLLCKKLPLEQGKANLFGNLVIFANIGLIGFPIIQQFYGGAGLLLAVFYNLLFNVFMFSFGIKRLGSKDASLKHLLYSPIVIALIFSLALFLSPFRIPEILAVPLQQIADTSAPFTMFVVGGGLAAMPIRSVVTNKWALLVTALRQLIIPLVTLGIMWCLGFRGIWPSTFVVLTALPTGTLNIITAQQYGGDVEFATQANVQGNLLMLITLPLILILCTNVLG